VTVGIGLVCGGGKYILLAADTRASYGTITSNDQSAKSFDLPAKYFGLIAGTLSQCEDVIAELYHRMAQLNEPQIAPEQVRRSIVDSYAKVYSEIADIELQNEFKFGLDAWKHDKQIVPSLRKRAQEHMKGVTVDVDLIVAGFYNGTPAQFVVYGGDKVTIRSEILPGNAVIGSGMDAALHWLNYRKQNCHLGLAHSLLHLTEAKQFAEVEQTVGPWRHMILLWPGNFKALNGGQEMLQGWWNRYGLPLSEALEDEKYDLEVKRTFGL
jgi:hypothetical protein